MTRPINNPNVERRIQQAVYHLKQEFGVPVDVYKMVSSQTDYDTGLKVQDITKISVRRAPMFPQGTSRLQYISPYFTQTQKPFITKGLGWDEVTDSFLFAPQDLRNFEFDVSDWIVHNHVRYEVKAVERLGSSCWFVGTTLAKGSPPRELLFEDVDSSMELTSEVEGALQVVFFQYFRPDGTSIYFRPGGVDGYNRP